MGGLVDGLGGEEMGQAGSQVSSIHLTGSIAADSQISGANVYSTGAVTGSEVSNADGLVKSVATGSPAVYNGQVQAGTVTLSAGSEADVEFGVPFTSKKYAITFGMSGAAASAALPTLSGVMTSSGATVIRDASATYYYVAAGY